MEIPNTEVHHYHHSIPEEPRINLTVEKNSRGYNFTVTVLGAATAEQATKLAAEAMTLLRNTYEVPPIASVESVGAPAA